MKSRRTPPAQRPLFFLATLNTLFAFARPGRSRGESSVLPPPSPLTAASRGSPSMPPPSPRTAAARRNETEQAMHALIEEKEPQFLSKKAVLMEILRHSQLHIFGKRKR